MVVRRIDTEATALQRQGELGLWPPLLGQEAAQIGSARALRDDDFVFPSYRENGVAYCRGVGPGRPRCASGAATATRRLEPVRRSTWRRRRSSSARRPCTPPATRMGIQNDGADSVAVAYFGDGATSQGDVNEAMVFAASFQAPGRLLLPEQPVGDLRAGPAAGPASASPTARAGFGIPSMRVDGNDVLAVHGRHALAARPRPPRRRARPSSRPSPTAWARTRPPTTPPATATPTSSSDWAAQGPDRPRRGAAGAHGRCSPTSSSATSPPRPTPSPRELRAGMPSACPTREPIDVFDHVYAEPHSGLDRQQRPLRRATSTASRMPRRHGGATR